MRQVFIILFAASLASQAFSQYVEPLPQSCNPIVTTFKVRLGGVSSSNFFLDEAKGPFLSSALEFQILSSNCLANTVSSYILKKNLSPFTLGLDKTIQIKGILTKIKIRVPTYFCYGPAYYEKTVWHLTPFHFDLKSL